LQFLYERLKDEMAYLRVYTDELKSVAQLLNAARQWEYLPYQIAEKTANVELKKAQKQKIIKQIKKEDKPKNQLNALLEWGGAQPPYLGNQPPKKVK
ncbi:hypothetical protein, partial [Caldisericum sp.]|uniref:hypothetical protein n=1 Tax=Caldisericum sp. TaxID=2499687 RepID=UPI003D0C986C